MRGEAVRQDCVVIWCKGYEEHRCNGDPVMSSGYSERSSTQHYRVRWAPTSENFLSYRDDNEAQRGNLYPLGGVTTLTLNNLTPGDSYKVQMRSRYYDRRRSHQYDRRESNH